MANHPNLMLNKIYDVFINLDEKFQIFYTPKRDISIDESLTSYNGRLGRVQYIPL